MPPKFQQVVLIILDGWGYREDPKNNAIAAAKKPFWDYLWRAFPHTLLAASGEAVGLPKGQMGNSEVGHPVIGTGTVIEHDFVRISKAVKTGEFAKNPVFKRLFDHVKHYNSTLHVQGLTTPGGVHSHQAHLHEFLKMAKAAGVEKVAIHAFTDGRDTPPQSGHKYLEKLEKLLENLGIGFIATATGRYYAMDRDNNWERTDKAIKALFHGVGKLTVTGKKPSQILRQLYQKGVMDEHLEPVIFLDNTGKSFSIGQNDGVLFFNFRADRTLQLSKRISEKVQGLNLCFVTMTEYDKTHKSITDLVAFPPLEAKTTLAKEISKAGLSQVHIAETEKYAHVTYFLNGGREEKQPGEEHVLVESRKDVATHDLAPQMRAKEITDKILEHLAKGANLIVCNFANPDLVGHTGNFAATVEAIEFLDTQLKRVVEGAIAAGAVCLITADHGNAEINLHESGERHTQHSENPVPAILTLKDVKLKTGGTLAGIAPTILQLFGLPAPKAMTGKSLLDPDDMDRASPTRTITPS